MTLLRTPISAPAERVEAATDGGTARFSRTLSHVRSSVAVIEEMPDSRPKTPAFQWAIYACTVVAMVVIYLTR
jgi:hypothetical protein